MRNCYRTGFHPRTGKNRRGYTRAACIKVGRACKGYETEDDIRQLALINAKGLTLRNGVTYSTEHPDGLPWCKRRSIDGRVDQIEIVLDGKIYRTTGESRLTGKLGWLRGRNHPH